MSVALDDLLIRTAPISERAAAADASALAKINALGPPAPLTAADVVIRGALIANDQVDAYATRFTPEALQQIAAMIVGQPMMRNHVTYSAEALPVARWFDAEPVTIDGINWVRAWFYMMTADEETASLLARIDGAVIREVSLAWWLGGMTCSICDQDAFGDACPHLPGEKYAGIACVGVMGSIRSVEECSLVWKGGQYGTKIEMAEARDARLTLVRRIAQKRTDLLKKLESVTEGPESALRKWWAGEASAELKAWYNKAG